MLFDQHELKGPRQRSKRSRSWKKLISVHAKQACRCGGVRECEYEERDKIQTRVSFHPRLHIMYLLRYDTYLSLRGR